ncbi:MAG: NERD domain-containing protein [Clostridia bacterium]|nr:NERD domain-containing protein [Clostridia bacterium]
MTVHTGRSLNAERLDTGRHNLKCWPLAIAFLLLYIPMFHYFEPIAGLVEWIVDQSIALGRSIPGHPYDTELWTVGDGGMLGSLLTLLLFPVSMILQLAWDMLLDLPHIVFSLLFILVIPAAVILLVLLFPVILAITVPDWKHKPENWRVLEAGVEGERAALGWASGLPMDGHVFANLFIEHNGRRSETDLITVTRGGVYVIEVKNYSGVVKGGPNSERLRRYRRLPDGSLEEKEDCYNPMRQVKTHVHNLAGYLRENGVNVFVTGRVLFTNPEMELSLAYPCAEACTWDERSELERELGEGSARTRLDDAQIARIAQLLDEAISRFSGGTA